MMTCAGLLPCQAGNLGDDRVGEHLTTAERRVALDLDAVLEMELPHVALLIEGMRLDLVDRRGDASLVDDAAEIFRQEVRHADRADQPFVARLDEGLPGLDIIVVLRDRPVDQEHVEIVEAKRLETVLDAFASVRTHGLRADLAGDEQVFAIDIGCPDGAADAGLVVVALGRVDVAIAGADGLAHDPADVVLGHLPDAETKLRDGIAVIERSERHAAGKGGVAVFADGVFVAAGRVVAHGFPPICSFAAKPATAA